MIQNAKIVDAVGNELHALPTDLDGVHLSFDVSGIPSGEVYRAEVWPDQDASIVHEIGQFPAGAHKANPQHFDVALTGRARYGYTISIHKVDSQTAQRDPNEEAPAIWERRYAVAR